MLPTANSLRGPERRRLDAWKAIAQHLGRDVTTVRRWEKREGLPVHRHLHAKLGSVYAFTDEIDEWWRRRSTSLETRMPPWTIAAESPVPIKQEPRSWRAGIVLFVVLAVTVALTAGAGLRAARTRVQPTLRLALAPPPGVVVESLVISPDGRRVAFAGRAGDGAHLWVRELESPASEVVPHTDGASFPFWSPDGQHIGFFADGRLKHVAIATREIRDLAPAPNGLGGTWNARGDIVFAPDRGAPLMRTSAAGGDVVAVTEVGQGFHEGHAWPEFLPDGRHLLYTDCSNRASRYGIYVHDLGAGTSRRVLAAYSRASYSSAGFLLYVKGSLLAQAFDLDRLEVRGEPTAVAHRVLQWGDLSYHADFSVSRDGVIVARTAAEERNKLVWIDRRSGQVVGTVGTAGYNSNPTLSPDGKTLAVTVHEDEADRDRIWLFNLETGEGRPFTEGTIDVAPIWWPGADRLLFASVRGGRVGVYQRSLDGGVDTAVPSAPKVSSLESSSRDGRYVTFATIDAKTKGDVWAWRLSGDRSVFPVVTSPANEGHSRLSPDGRWLAYASDESGRFEIYVRSFPESDATWQVSTAGGADPQWSRDGRELYFVADDRTMMVAKVTTRPTFRIGSATPVFDTGLEVLWQDTRNHYDVAPDGRRLILLVPETDRRAAPFTVIVNWASETAASLR